MKHTAGQMDKRVQRTMHDIEKAMVELLFEGSYEAISVEDILKRSNYSRNAFYTHYNGKEGCMTAILDREAQRFVNCFSTQLKKASSSDPQDKDFSLLYMAIYEGIYQNQILYRFLFRNENLPWLIRMEYEINSGLRKMMDFSELTDALAELDMDMYLLCNTRFLFSSIEYWGSKNFEMSPIWMAKQIHLHDRLCMRSLTVADEQ